MTETTVITCEDCGTEFEHPRSYTCQPSRCEECEHERLIQKLRDDCDPAYDGTFSRPDALQRLKDEGEMPIVDYDGGLITGLQVDTLPSQSPWIESITKITDCPECGYERATYKFCANGGHHRMTVWDCQKCGHYVNQRE